ncbi:TauD/TfdA family dioxygenase [Nonomuraea sp. NPDC048882]|uniref:TauD/TfdA family dioxygenase n=1 Tax=Nonomuraea sp. NPDC048882 TaxID=3154347 RepID=UPI0033E025B9
MHAATQSNASSTVTLSLHTEIAFHSIRPDFVALYCVRSPVPAPATRVALIDEIIQGCPSWVIEILSQDRFSISPPDSFLISGVPDRRVTLTPLLGSAGRRTIRWHSSVRGLDPEAEAAAVKFREVASSLAYPVALTPGTLLVFANDRCLHGRDTFQASYNQADRWLLRTYILRDIMRISLGGLAVGGSPTPPIISARSA